MVRILVHYSPPSSGLNIVTILVCSGILGLWAVLTTLLTANLAFCSFDTSPMIPCFLTRFQPCLFLALDYSILGRLSGTLGPEVSSKTMFITPTCVAKIFVWGDVCTFLMQALDGSMTTSSSRTSANLGNKVCGSIPRITVSSPDHSDRTRYSAGIVRAVRDPRNRVRLPSVRLPHSFAN